MCDINYFNASWWRLLAAIYHHHHHNHHPHQFTAIHFAWISKMSVLRLTIATTLRNTTTTNNHTKYIFGDLRRQRKCIFTVDARWIRHTTESDIPINRIFWTEFEKKINSKMIIFTFQIIFDFVILHLFDDSHHNRWAWKFAFYGRYWWV